MPETLDLRPVRARLDWAAGHANRVRELSTAWGRDALVETESVDKDRDIRVRRYEVNGDPPVSIALALGDTLQQARGTLDNLVGVLRGGATRRSAFKIDTDPDEFDRDKGKLLEGVPPWAVASFREVQPFPDNPMRFVGAQLDQLHELAIVDRHRAVLLSAALMDPDRTYASTTQPGETDFAVLDGGRVMTVSHPRLANVDVVTRVQVIVREDVVRWPVDDQGRQVRFPGYPEAAGLAADLVGAVRAVLDNVTVAGRREGVMVVQT